MRAIKKPAGSRKPTRAPRVPEKFTLRLYVAGQSPKSIRAFANLNSAVERRKNASLFRGVKETPAITVTAVPVPQLSAAVRRTSRAPLEAFSQSVVIALTQGPVSSRGE